MNIDSDYQIDDLTLIKYLKSVESPFLPMIKTVYDQVKDILNTRVQYVFSNYTLHNTGHSFRVMEYMSKLINDYKQLNELEITMLIYSALLHDIGMAVSEEDKELIMSDSFDFCPVKYSAMKKIMIDDDLALQEYVRRIHGSLSGKYIRENLKNYLCLPRLTTLDFVNELALVCESHTEDYDWIKTKLHTNEVRGDYTFNSQFVACILRLADILDIDGNRTPYNLYKLISPKDKSDMEWRQHFVISNNDKIYFNEKTQQKKIVFHGKADNASIHRKILTYIGWIKNELIDATSLVNTMPSQYNMVYDTNPEINIQTEGYTFSDYKMTLEYRAISSLLMGEKIYGSKSLGLRELIQNAMDSCRIRQENEESSHEFGQDKYIPKIRIIFDKEKNHTIIKDNGCGMSLNVIKNHFLNIGVSYYNSTDFLLKDYTYRPVGNYGIGFLSCFMLSDEVKVITRYYKEKNKYLIELEKGNEWTSLTESEDVQFEGTEVILSYNNFMAVFDNKIENVSVFMGQYFLTDGIEFEIIDKSSKQKAKISNPLSNLNPSETGLISIDLKNYLNEIEGYVLLKNKHSFIKKFEEVGISGEIYLFDEINGFKQIADTLTLNIDDYVNDRQLKYLSIPIIDSSMEDDFISGMKFTGGDVDEVIGKLDRELTWISVIFPKELQNDLFDETIENGRDVNFKFPFNELINIGQSVYCETKAYVKIITLFEGCKNTLYLPFTKREMYEGYWERVNKRKELFVRSVLIKDFKFNIPISASIFEIHTIMTNIYSKKIIPDISRNNVDDNSKMTINYMIGKAIHRGAVDTLILDKEEKQTLQKFTSTYYEQQTGYEK